MSGILTYAGGSQLSGKCRGIWQCLESGHPATVCTSRYLCW